MGRRGAALCLFFSMVSREIAQPGALWVRCFSVEDVDFSQSRATFVTDIC